MAAKKNTKPGKKTSSSKVRKQEVNKSLRADAKRRSESKAVK